MRHHFDFVFSFCEFKVKKVSLIVVNLTVELFLFRYVIINMQLSDIEIKKVKRDRNKVVINKCGQLQRMY